MKGGKRGKSSRPKGLQRDCLVCIVVSEVRRARVDFAVKGVRDINNVGGQLAPCGGPMCTYTPTRQRSLTRQKRHARRGPVCATHVLRGSEPSSAKSLCVECRRLGFLQSLVRALSVTCEVSRGLPQDTDRRSFVG